MKIPQNFVAISEYMNFRKKNALLGNIHVLRKQKGGREGVSQMLTIAYVGGGGV